MASGLGYKATDVSISVYPPDEMFLVVGVGPNEDDALPITMNKLVADALVMELMSARARLDEFNGKVTLAGDVQ